MRALYITAAALLVGLMIGVGVTGPLLEPILVYFFPEPENYILVPVDYNPFLPFFEI